LQSRGQPEKNYQSPSNALSRVRAERIDGRGFKGQICTRFNSHNKQNSPCSLCEKKLTLVFPAANSRVQELFKVVQTNEGQLSGWIIQWFTTQKNRRSEEYCKLKEKILAWGVGFVENLACFAWGFVPTGDRSPAAASAISGVSNILQSYFAMTQLEVEMVVLEQQLDADEEWGNAKQNATGELMLDIPYAVGVCGSIGKFDLLVALSFIPA
jgi:hypothetical protein